MVRAMLAALVMLVAAVPAAAREIEPKTVQNLRSVRAGHGAVIFSLRSQAQLGGKLRVYFEAADDVARGHAEHLRFERAQGAPFLGSNMIDRKARAYSLPAGRWRLLAHVTACAGIPPPGSECIVLAGGSGSHPTGRYDGSSIVFDVQPGRVLNAGELMLEYPEGTDLGVSYGALSRLSRTLRLKWRPLPENVAAPLLAPFRGVPVVNMEGVASAETSNVRCDNDRAKIQSGLVLPFLCEA